ncbi:MAG: ADP-ribosylglycohydrolase family protein [Bacilli bacterium]|nr:ADP-ribosylglycohydrolase family protein [Bacilli bacterium]
MKRKPLALLLLASMLLSSCGEAEESETTSSESIPSQSEIDDSEESTEPRVYEYQTLDRAVVRDKILGSWIGNAIGLGSGYEYVVATDNVSDVEEGPIQGYTVGEKTAIVALDDHYWEPNGEICSGSIGVNALRLHPVCDPRVVRNSVYSDDDMHVDIMEQFLFRDYGPLLGNNDIASAWRFYDVHDAGGGSDAANLIQNSQYISPYSGQSTYGSIGYWVTEAWIENDSLGLLFPYMYETADAYADMFTQVQGDAYGYFLGKLCTMMFALTYQYNDAKTILEEAFKIMGTSNEVYDTYQFVKKCYKNKVSWRQACIGVVERSVNCSKIRISDMAGFSLNALAGMIFIGLMYGENDFEESVRITSLCGLDGDCTAATVGGILGAMLGFEALPEKYKGFLNGRSNYYNHTGSNGYATGVYWGAFAYCGKNFPNSLTFDELTDLTLSNMEAMVECFHGEVNGSQIKVAKQNLTEVERVKIENYSFEKGDISNWNVEGTGISLAASPAGNHIGTNGGVISLEEATSTGRVYQNVKLTKGHTYKMNLWVNGGTDREFQLFASDSEHDFHRSYVNPVYLSNRHMKGEMRFQATSDEMKVGIYLPQTFEDAYSALLNIDDLFLDDITHYQSERRIKSYEVEQMELGASASVKQDSGSSGGSYVHLGEDGEVRGHFTANGQLQSFRLHYQNRNATLGTVAIYVDEHHVANLPLPGTGISSQYNDSHYANMDMYFEPGEHDLKMVYRSFDDIELDRLDIQNANACLEV